MKTKNTGKTTKRLSHTKNGLKHLNKSGRAPQENESSSPVCYSGKEKFREGFEDLMTGKTGSTRE